MPHFSLAEMKMTSRSPRSKRGRLRRGDINLTAHVGKAVRLELYDDDPAGRLYVDDLRFTD